MREGRREAAFFVSLDIIAAASPGALQATVPVVYIRLNNNNARLTMALRPAPLLLALAAPFLLCGCVSSPQPLQITYISDPPGALVVDSAGKAWGRAPVTLAYTDALMPLRQGQCVYPWPITMHWPSGAQQTMKPVACPGDGRNQQLVIDRPKDAPGIDLDVRFAAEIGRAHV